MGATPNRLGCSVLGNVLPEHVRTEPFAHLVVENCLPADYYAALAADYPTDADVLRLNAWRRKGSANQNQRNDISAHQALGQPGLVSPIWEEFVRYHTSAAFYREVVSLFGPAIRAAYPQLEKHLARSLESLETGVRFDPESDRGAISLDCQIGINTPVTRQGSVRGVHVDAPEELFALLLYMRRDEDDATGSDFEIHRWKPGRSARFVRTEADPADTLHVQTIPYRANTLVAFVNSENALHAVSPRGVTPHSRRLVNLLGETYRCVPEGLFVKRQKRFGRLKQELMKLPRKLFR